MAANDKKDTIYVDVDDEITGVIDKVQASSGKVVALVLPKRAAVFQSIVNMKLLKRAADGADKNLVLITTEAGLLPLAGVAGIHVARTLNSKPEVPVAPQLNDEPEESVNEDGEVTAESAGDKPVGDLAAKPAAAGGMETLTLDDDTLPEESPAAAAKPKSFEPPAKGKGGKGKKKPKIPDFNRFRLMLIAGGAALILLIFFLFMGIKVWPKATIVVDTNSQKVDSNLSLNLSTAAKELDPETGTVPAKAVQQQKTYSQQVATTGQKNNGNRASGTVVLTNCSGNPVTLPAGTGLSSAGNTYITQQSVSVPDSTYTKQGSCHNDGRANVTIVAQNPGSAYNGATNFTVAGQSDMAGSPSGSITGGTDNIVHSVNQNDIDNAKSKINTNDPSVKQALVKQLKDQGYYVIDATFNSGTPVVTQSANVGAVADNVTVTETVTYTLFGVQKKDLRTLVENDVDSQIDTSKQKLQNDGLDNANFNVDNQTVSNVQMTMSTSAIAGPDVDIASIQKNAAGQKAGKIKSDLQGYPGVKSVDVKLSPFWVSSVPKNTDKIHVVIAEPKSK